MTYTFNSHRDALYKVLEATVRELASADCNDGRQTSSMSFPSPFMWYDEIRPPDIDAYRAASRNGRVCTKSGGNAETGSLGSAAFRSRDKDGNLNRPCAAMKDAPIASEGRVSPGGGHSVPCTCVAEDGVARTPAAVRKDLLNANEGGSPAAAPPGSKKWELKAASATRPDRCTRSVVVSSSALQSLQSERLPCYYPHCKADEEQRGEGKDAGGKCSSQSRDKFGSSSAISSIAPTSYDPSQATQTLFLPGLPSQVLVTQPQGDTGWEHPEGDESSQNEEDSAMSEYALSFPPNHRCPSAEEALLTGASVDESVGGNLPFRSGVRSSNQGPHRGRGNSSEVGVAGGGSGGMGTVAIAREQDEAARSRLNDDFTRALRDQLDRGSVGVASARRAAPIGSGRARGREQQLTPSLAFVSTEEVLPSGWGQGGVVAFLESRLLVARQRVPDGYAARALELACHVLRQPTVCVWAIEHPGASSGRSCAAAVDFAGAALRGSDHPDVVGIPVFVWEILREERRENPSQLAIAS